MPKHIKPAPQATVLIEYVSVHQFGRQDKRIVDLAQHNAFKQLTGRVVLLEKDFEALAVFGCRFEEIDKMK